MQQQRPTTHGALTGPFPPSPGPLPNLQGMKSLSNLTVQYSSLNGPLPPASALPRSVRSIVLSGNQLSGAHH